MIPIARPKSVVIAREGGHHGACARQPADVSSVDLRRAPRGLRTRWRAGWKPTKIDAMTAQSSPPPIEDLLLELVDRALGSGSFARRALHDLSAVDHAVYQAIASTSTPAIDVPLRHLSDAANRSLIWVAASGMLACLGGTRGRRAAVAGLAAVARVVGRGERGSQTARRANTPGPRLGRRDSRPPYRNAPLLVLPIRTLRIRFRIRDSHRSRVPHAGDPTPSPGGCGRVLARPLWRPLPRGRRRRLARGRFCGADALLASPLRPHTLGGPCRRVTPRPCAASPRSPSWRPDTRSAAPPV